MIGRVGYSQTTVVATPAPNEVASLKTDPAAGSYETSVSEAEMRITVPKEVACVKMEPASEVKELKTLSTLSR